MSLVEEILGVYAARGAGAYFGERVSMTEHGLQAAHFAQAERAPQPLILAALLHDVGHLLEEVPDAIEDWRSDARHEEVGARWLARRFGAGGLRSRCACTYPRNATCVRPMPAISGC